MDSARVATDNERVQAAQLLLEGLGADLLVHEQQSGAVVSFLVWPESGPIQSAAAMVLYGDGTAFFYPPVGERHPTALEAIYSQLVLHAKTAGADVVIAMAPANHPGFADEVASHNFRRVGFALSMRCREPQTIRALARFAAAPEHVGHTDRDDERLVRLIDRTYVGSLSDPALGSNHRAAGFLDRLKRENPDHQDRLVYSIDGLDAAVCLLCRHNAARHVTVRYLGVAPEFRGRKLGGKLLAASLAEVWTKQYDYASVEVDEGNHFAVRLYQELGFREASRAEEFALRVS